MKRWLRRYLRQLPLKWNTSPGGITIGIYIYPERAELQRRAKYGGRKGRRAQRILEALWPKAYVERMRREFGIDLNARPV